jgi:glycerol dehydrogenase-like iron-containing ADH family enzyme
MMEHIESIYGDDVLPGELARAGDYVALVDPIAWALCGERLPGAPAGVLEPSSLEQAALDDLAAEVPAGATVVGVGGGLVIDAAKYVARRDGRTVVLVPSITSSNAPFSDAISVRRDGVPTGMREPSQTKRVVVDYTLIGAADPRLNRAGYADVLAHETALADWRRAADRGALAMDEAAFAAMTALLSTAREAAPAIGAVDHRGVETLMRLFEQTTALTVAHPHAPMGAGSEHLLAWNLEGVTGRHFIHGEVVALGVLVAAHVQGGDAAGLRAALDQARVRYRPADIGVEWSELERALETVADYNRRVRRFHTVFEDTDWTPALRAEIRELVGA